MELFNSWMGEMGGGQALGRYAHYLGGITWIGLLYFFNFIQGAAFGEMSDGARGEALRKIPCGGSGGPPLLPGCPASGSSSTKS